MNFDEDNLAMVARASAYGTVGLCSCDLEEVGDAESGPRLSVTPVETCALHGREAMPDEWAENDRVVRGYICSGVGSILMGLNRDLYESARLSAWIAANADLVVAMHAAALERLEGEDDGFDSERAIGDTADALIPLLTRGRTPLRVCDGCGTRVPNPLKVQT